MKVFLKLCARKTVSAVSTVAGDSNSSGVAIKISSRKEMKRKEKGY
jgi:hypothetical protein